MRLVACSLVLASLVACGGPGYALTVSTPKPTAAKAATCDFQVVTLPPSRGYEEIAMLSPTGDVAYDPVEFKRLVHAQVCSIGGDMVLSEVNGLAYIRGTVLRKTE
jgi:hypothetical protein